MSSIVWLPEALQDMARLFGFLKEKNPKAARQAAQTIQKGADQLKTFPEIGRPMNDETQRRELVIPFGQGAYVLRYRLDQKRVVVLRVWHGRENRS